MSKYDRYEVYSWATNALDFIEKEQKIKFVDYGASGTWSVEKNLSLLDDLVNSEKKKEYFFLGSIIYTIKRFKKTNDLYKNVYEVTIVDGKKRIQALMLILLAIKNVLRTRHEGQNLMETVDHLLFSSTGDQRDVRLVFSKDEEQKIFEQLAYEGVTNAESQDPVFQSYDAIRAKLADSSLEQLNEIFSFLSESVYFVEISIREEKNDLAKIYHDVNNK